MKSRRDLFYLVLLFALCIIFWEQALSPGKVFFMRDLATDNVPKRFFFAHSQGFRLWCPLNFFGIPFAANPQSEAFYPFNFFFLLFSADRGMVYYIVFHHLVALLALYPALRSLGFREESSLIGSIGFGFGGFMVSLSQLLISLSTVAWFPLLLLCLARACDKNWLRWSLLAALAVALQVLGGEVEMAAMSWGLAFAGALFRPAPRVWTSNLTRALSSLVFAVIFGCLLALPQIALTLQMIPLSNRSAGVSQSLALDWTLPLSEWKTMLAPNYFLPLSSGALRPLGIFASNPFFLSSYLGATVLALGVFSFSGRRKLEPVFWMLATLFGLAMICGDQFPLYGALFKYLPGMRFFRAPAKFIFFINFSAAMLACFGLEHVSGWRRKEKFLPAVLMIAAITIFAILVFSPVKPQEFGSRISDISRYLWMRSVMRTSAIGLAAFSLIILIRPSLGILPQLALALLVSVDMGLAHCALNPPTGRDFYSPNPLLKQFLDRHRSEIPPPRIFSMGLNPRQSPPPSMSDPIVAARARRDAMLIDWSMFFGLGNVRTVISFCPADIHKLELLAQKSSPCRLKLIMSRAGVGHLSFYDSGFEKLRAFPRAMVFYQAESVDDQDQAIQTWADPAFPADRFLLLEGVTGMANPGQGLPADPARINEYKNEKVEVEADARQPGWLMLLDSYYPGWKAEVDGKRVEILRADGFFRAVKIPAGKHIVTFSYFPDIFRKSLYVSGAGLLLWVLLASISCRLATPRIKSSNPGWSQLLNATKTVSGRSNRARDPALARKNFLPGQN